MIRFLCACGSFHIAHTDDETLLSLLELLNNSRQ